MPRRAPLLTVVLPLLAVLAGGCNADPKVTREEDFSPAKLRLHPTFTQIHDWTGDKKPDGVDVVVELLDSFGEPTRGRGTLLFELWSYRKYDPNVLGSRIVDPWKRTILTREEQDALWNKTLRAYTFQLPFDKANPTREYILTASFETAGGADKPNGIRLYDRLILEPAPGKKVDDKGVKSAGSSKRGR